MDLYNESLNSRLILDSERAYYQAITDSFRRITEQLNKTSGVYTSSRLKHMQSLFRDELLTMNKDFANSIEDDLIRSTSADLEAYDFDKQGFAIAQGLEIGAFAINKKMIQELILQDDFLFSYIKANGDVVKTSLSLKEMFNSIPNSTYKKVNSIFMAGASIGDSPDKIARDLRPFYTTQQKHNVRTVVRTLIGEASAKAHMAWDDNNLKYINHWIYEATLDINTSSICRTLDGKTWTKKPPVYYRPKLHPNCRSILVSVPNGYSRGHRPINLMTPKDKKHAITLKSKERELFYKSKIKTVNGSYTYSDAVNDYPQLNNKKFINIKEYEAKLGII